MKEFNSYAAIGSLDRKTNASTGNKKRKSVSGGGGANGVDAIMTMTLDRPRSHVNNNNHNTSGGGGGGGDAKNNSEVVAIRTSLSSNQIVDGFIEGGGGVAYKIPRPVMGRSLSEQQREDLKHHQQQLGTQRQFHNDMGIEIVDKSQKIVLRTFGGGSSSGDAQVLFCESSSDGEFVTVDFDDGGEEDEGGDGEEGRRRRRSFGFNDSAA